MESIKSEMKDKKLYLQVDESFMDNRKIFVVIIGQIDQPEICHCVSVEIVPTVNHFIVKQLITSVFYKYKLEETNLFLFLSDSASYMKSSVLSLRTIFLTVPLSSVKCIFCTISVINLKAFTPRLTP